MKKSLLLIFGILVGLPAISQTQQLAEILKIWKRVDIPVQDGTVYKWNVYTGSDTARYFQPGLDTLEATITFKKKTVIVLPDIISTMDDNVVSLSQVYNPPINVGDNVITATGWSHFKNQTWNANHHANSYSFVEVAGAYVELSCTCYKVEWWSELRVNHGIASVQIDGGAAIDVDQYDPRTDNNSLKIWTSPDMTNATHKIRINYTGRKHPSSQSTNIGHDKFVIYTKQQ